MFKVQREQSSLLPLQKGFRDMDFTLTAVDKDVYNREIHEVSVAIMS